MEAALVTDSSEGWVKVVVGVWIAILIYIHCGICSNKPD